jgi:hypothetical protein
MRLYEIPEAMRVILAEIEDHGGEITPELEARFDGLNYEFNRKAEYIALLSKEAAALAEGVKIEEERLVALRKRYQNRSDRLKEYLLASMQRAGIEKVDGDLASPAVQRNSVPRVEVTIDPLLLPEPYRRVRVEADSAALRKAADAGEELPDGVTLSYGYHLRIR